jgi:hypothetical protein
MGLQTRDGSEERSPPGRTLLRAVALPLHSCCCPYPFVLNHRDRTNHLLCAETELGAPAQPNNAPS